jgi:hypothetical protein
MVTTGEKGIGRVAKGIAVRVEFGVDRVVVRVFLSRWRSLRTEPMRIQSTSVHRAADERYFENRLEKIGPKRKEVGRKEGGFF